MEGHGKVDWWDEPAPIAKYTWRGQKTLSVPWFQLRLPRRALGVCKDNSLREKSTVKLTPMMQQYYELKEQYPTVFSF